MEITCGKCHIKNKIDDVKCKNNGSSGHHTTSYTYSANFICWRCKRENNATIFTDELDDTGEVLDYHITYN